MVALGIADDEPDILRLFKIMLDRKGYPIAYMARNGDEAVEKHRQNPAEIVIMDYSMPFKDGVEAAKDILKEFPGTKFFLMTCGEDVSGVLKGLDMVTIVKKPFTFKSMISLLERSVCM
jgi:YesN/AraC family two-component response regulator